MKSTALVLLAAMIASVFGGAEAFVQRQFGVRSSSTAPLQMTVLSYNGKKKNFPPGSPMNKAIAALGVKVKYSCKK